MFGLEGINFGAIENRDDSLTREAEKAIALAKRGTYAIVTLQAIAALSALGIFLIQASQYREQKRRRKSSRRSKR